MDQNTIDLINAFFPFVGCLFVIINIRQMIKDKMMKGSHWLTPLFFYIGQAWGIFFCYSLNQWFSFIGSFMLLVCSIVWYLTMIYYKFFNK
jgi:hypothetical protein